MRFLTLFFLFFSAAVAWAEKDICTAADAAGCLDLAWKYDAGYPPFSPDRSTALEAEAAAIRHYEDRCKSGEWETCQALYGATFHTLSEDVSNNDVLEALQLWQSVTEEGYAAGSVRACAARSLLKGIEIEYYYASAGIEPPSRKEARQYFERAQKLFGESYLSLRDSCWDGDAEACNDEALNRLSVAVMPADVRHAMGSALIGCYSLPEACETLAQGASLMARASPDGSPEHQIALSSLLRACQEKLGAACLSAATLETDSAATSSLLEQSCAADSAEGCLRIGLSHHYDFTRTQDRGDLVQAVDALEKACAGNKAVACHTLRQLTRQ